MTQFGFVLEHRPGKKHTNVDACSRMRVKSRRKCQWKECHDCYGSYDSDDSDFQAGMGENGHVSLINNKSCGGMGSRKFALTNSDTDENVEGDEYLAGEGRNKDQVAVGSYVIEAEETPGMKFTL